MYEPVLKGVVLHVGFVVNWTIELSLPSGHFVCQWGMLAKDLKQKNKKNLGPLFYVWVFLTLYVGYIYIKVFASQTILHCCEEVFPPIHT